MKPGWCWHHSRGCGILSCAQTLPVAAKTLLIWKWALDIGQNQVSFISQALYCLSEFPLETESISPLNPRKQTRLARERNRWSILDAFPPFPSLQFPLGLSNVCWALTGVLEWKFNSKAEYRSWHDSGFYPVMGHMLFFPHFSASIAQFPPAKILQLLTEKAQQKRLLEFSMATAGLSQQLSGQRTVSTEPFWAEGKHNCTTKQIHSMNSLFYL